MPNAPKKRSPKRTLCTCGSCIWFVRYDPQCAAFSGVDGECHVFPPVPVSVTQQDDPDYDPYIGWESVRPTVDAHDRCSKWAKNVERTQDILAAAEGLDIRMSETVSNPQTVYLEELEEPVRRLHTWILEPDLSDWAWCCRVGARLQEIVDVAHRLGIGPTRVPILRRSNDQANEVVKATCLKNPTRLEEASDDD